jgi:hypothetical protein
MKDDMNGRASLTQAVRQEGEPMQPDKRRRIATLEFSAGCLQEAVERLHRLCPLLHNPQHETECTEAAKNISSQVLIIQQEVAELRSET